MNNNNNNNNNNNPFWLFYPEQPLEQVPEKNIHSLIFETAMCH